MNRGGVAALVGGYGSFGMNPTELDEIAGKLVNGVIELTLLS